MEQLSTNEDLDPINEPDLDVDAIELPEEGDFEYEFDVEVRPEFDLPNYDGLTIERPIRKMTDADVDRHVENFLSQYGQLVPHEEPVEAGDVVSVSLESRHDEQKLLDVSEVSLRVRPVLRFTDAELNGFDKLMAGAGRGTNAKPPSPSRARPRRSSCAAKRSQFGSAFWTSSAGGSPR